MNILAFILFILLSSFLCVFVLKVKETNAAFGIAIFGITVLITSHTLHQALLLYLLGVVGIVLMCGIKLFLNHLMKKEINA